MEKIKVLLIDDDEDDFVLTKAIFSKIASKQKYELNWASSFESGINAAVKNQADIYLVDYSLGKKTGLHLVEEAVKSNISAPFIILTGKGDYAIDQQAMNLGAADYLVKDEIEPQSLDRAIRYALKHANAMRAMKESENKYRILFERAKDAIMISDFTGKVHDINEAGLSLFGYSISEILQTNDREIFYNTVERDEFIQALETKGAITDFECQMLTKDGKLLHCILSSFLQIDTVNMAEFYHTIIHNFTSRKGSAYPDFNNTQVTITEKLALKFSDDIRSELSLANMSLYDLSNNTAVLKDENAKELLTELKNSCEKIDALTESFIVASIVKSDFSAHNIKLLVEEVLSDFEIRFAAEGVKLDLNILPSEKKVKMDKSKIKEALGNLLNNAIESLTDDSKILNVSTFSDGGMYSILIEDSGVGIANENRAKIFAPLFSTKVGAEGMGLTDAQRIVLEHNGSIDFKALESGSLFTVNLPIAK